MEQAERHYNRGIALGRSGKWGDAAEAFHQAIALNDANAQWHYRLALAYQRLQKWMESATAFEHAIRLSGDQTSTFYKLDWRHRWAFAYRMMNMRSEAIRIYEEASRSDPPLSLWIEHFRQTNESHGELSRLTRFWELIDGDIESEMDALDIIASKETLSCAFSDKWWMAAYVALYKRGWPRAAYESKAAAAEVLRSLRSKLTDLNPHLCNDVAVGFAEGKQYTDAISVLKNLIDDETPKKAALRRSAVEFASGLALLNGDLEEARTLWDLSARLQGPVEGDEGFRALVKGKSLAVVAPGNTEAKHGHEIESFDLVVRTNFRSHDIIRAQSALLGSRTDICYFNGNFEPDNRAAIVAELKRAPLKYAVLRFNDESMDVYRPILPVRVSRIFNAFYRMNTYAIPKIVFDLLRFSPSRIKVFNADFYLANHKHYEGYYNYDMDLLVSFFGHDILRNFRLLKGFFQHGYFEADDTLSEILSRSEEQVIDRVSAIVAALKATRA